MLREAVFFLGGASTIGLGVALGVGLWWSGAGLEFASGWIAAGISVGFGAFFLRVGQQARAHRRAWLVDVAAGRTPPPGGPLG